MEGGVLKKGMSIKESIKFVFLVTVIQMLIMFIFAFLAAIFEAQNLIILDTYITLAGEIISWIYVSKKYILKKLDFDTEYLPEIKGYLFTTLLLVGFVLVYDNTFEPLLSNVKEFKWVVDHFDKLLNYPLAAFISIVLVAPFFEEILFRGVILKELAKRYSISKAIIVSSLLFALIHMNPHQGVLAFFSGIVLGVIYYKTKSLVLSIFAHSLNNLFSVIVEYYFPVYSEQVMIGFNLIQFMIGILILFISFWLLSNYKINLNKKFTFKTYRY